MEPGNVADGRSEQGGLVTADFHERAPCDGDDDLRPAPRDLQVAPRWAEVEPRKKRRRLP